MKIALASDLHLEFGTISFKNEGADVLVLSGDICVADSLNDNDTYNLMGEATHSIRYHKFFQECCENFPHVIYVAGNHEHYNGDFALTIARLKEKLSYLKNLYILEKEMKTIDDVTFIGGTLWTNMNNMDSLTLYDVKHKMNDFRIVDNSSRKVTRKVPLYKKDEKGDYVLDEKGFMIQDGFKFKEDPAKFCPEDAASDHVAMMEFIRHTIAGMKDEKFVVVGHHAPSKLSTKPRYEKDVTLNGAYSSDLSEFMLDHPQIKLWTHGHTHHAFEYVIGETKVVCNPRGYIGYEPDAHYFKLKYLEV